jgi:ABC-2 type transport system permease protein
MSTATVPSNKFTWLLKREFWEYRGAFFWTPAITAMVMLALVLMGLVIAEVSANRAGVSLNGINFNQISKHLSEGDAGKVYAALNVGLISLGFPIAAALFFVLFTYGIGALFNDRADRSVLFWKSLPISDTETVLAKVIAMAVIAPVLAVGAMIALHLGFLIVMSLWVLAHGINPALLWSPTHLLTLWIKLLLLVPVNALWALPSIGWLLLCSSFARSKPFLWAVALPIVTAVLISMFHLMNSLSLPSGWFWKNVVGRLLLSLIPGTWVDVTGLRGLTSDDRLPEALGDLLSFSAVGDLIVSPTFLIGVAAGMAMIFGAIHFRRQRTESYA